MCRILLNGTMAEDQHILHASQVVSWLSPKGIQLYAALSGSRYWCPQCNSHLASRMGFCECNTKHSGLFFLSNQSSLSVSLHHCILWNHTQPQVYHNSLATNIKWFIQETVCLVILNVTIVKLCTSVEINSKVDFDAIKLCIFQKTGCLFISFVDFHIYQTVQSGQQE